MKLPLYFIWVVCLIAVTGFIYETISVITAPRWKLTNSLNVPRINPALIQLKSGKILAIGGDYLPSPCEDDIGGTCEIYDPASGQWTLTGSLQDPHIIGTYRETQTSLLTTGQVLVLTQNLDRSHDDGVRFAISYMSQVYDPNTGKWTKTDLNSGLGRFYNFIASTSGLVYLWDKCSPERPLSVLDPVKGRIIDKVVLPTALSHYVLSGVIPLQDGKMALDFDDTSAAPDKEYIAYYDPVAHHLSSLHNCALGDIYDMGTVIASKSTMVNIESDKDVVFDLSNSKLMVGRKVHPPRNNTITYDVYDKKLIEDDTVNPQITYFPLPSGHILAVGGLVGRHSIIEDVQNEVFGKVYWEANAFSVASSQTEVLQPKEPNWNRSASLRVPRAGAAVSLLNNGMVLAVGGDRGGDVYHNATKSCELVSLKTLDPE